jgi:hypothetical protein
MSWLVTFLIEASNAKFNRAVKPAKPAIILLCNTYAAIRERVYIHIFHFPVTKSK